MLKVFKYRLKPDELQIELLNKHIDKDLTLSDEEWTCKNCGALLNRDINAAINVKNFVLKNILSGTDRKNQNELSTLVEVMISEVPSPLAWGSLMK